MPEASCEHYLLLGSAYLFIVALYYEQAEAIEKVRSQESKSEVEKESKIDEIKAEGLRKYAPEIGILGRINIAVPVLVGVLAALALLLGPKKP